MSRAIQVMVEPTPSASRCIRIVERVGTSVPVLVRTLTLPLHQPAVRRAGRISSSMIDRSDSITRSRSEEHTSELQSLMRISYAVFCLKKKNKQPNTDTHTADRTSYTRH